MSYTGSKGQAGVWQTIIGQMPAHSLYVEPFFGSGQVFWRKRPADLNVIIDADAGVLASFDADCQRRPSGLTLQASTRAIHGDSLVILPEMALPADAVVYCDPPYPLQTRQNRRYYAHEMSDLDHTSLLELLDELPCRVLLSGVPHPMYDTKLKDWRCIRYRTRWHNKTATECLWLNFPEPVELHDWRFAGKTHRERLTLKRLAARYLARFERMTPRKRAFVLELIASRHNWRRP